MKKPTLSTHNCRTVHPMKASNNKKLIKHQIMAGLDDIKSGKVSDGKKFMRELKEKISILIALERDPFYSMV